MSDTRIFQKGETIIQEGTSGAFAYVVSSGFVEVSKKVKGEKFVLSKLGEGSIIGEMSLIDGKPRSATVTALEDTEVKVITRQRMEHLLEKNPRALVPLLKQVFQRLRYLNQMVTAFCGQVEQVDTGVLELKPRAPLELTALTKEARNAMDGEKREITHIPFQIGRSTAESLFGSNDLSLHDSKPYTISRCHCLISMVNNQYYLVDTVSSRGTTVDGIRIGGLEEKKRFALDKGKHRIVLGGEDSPYVFELEVP
ncbi:MAG: cyclic nucleotide-binding domain-containing protein [Syntrophobacteria bacterium]